MSEETSTPTSTEPTSEAPVEESSSSEESQTEGGSASEETSEESAAPSLHKVKIDGQEMEVSLDDLLKGYQTNRAAQKRFEEASMTKKEAQELLENFKNNPMAAFEKAGIDFFDFADHVVSQQAQYQEMTEEQRENLRLQQELERYKALEQQQLQAQQEQQFQAEIEAQTTVISGIIKENGLPNTTGVQQSVAHYMYTALENGLEPDPALISSLVKEDLKTQVKNATGGATAEQLIEIFGEDAAKALREYELKKVETPKNNYVKSEEPVKREKPEAEPKSASDFFENVGLDLDD